MAQLLEQGNQAFDVLHVDQALRKGPLFARHGFVVSLLVLFFLGDLPDVQAYLCGHGAEDLH